MHFTSTFRGTNMYIPQENHKWIPPRIPPYKWIPETEPPYKVEPLTDKNDIPCAFEEIQKRNPNHSGGLLLVCRCPKCSRKYM